VISGVLALVAPARSRAQSCTGSAIRVRYTADSLPEDASPPWTPELASSATASTSGGVLTLDGLATYHRVEEVGGLVPSFTLSALVRIAPGTMTIGAVAQDKEVLFDLTAVTDPQNRWQVLLSATPKGSGEVLSKDAASFHQVTLEAVRDGDVDLYVDGQSAGSVKWTDLQDVDPSAWPGSYLTSSDQALVLFGTQGAQSEWDEVDYTLCRAANVVIGVQTVVPSNPADQVLKGGMGETLDGLTSLTAHVDRVDVVERSDPQDPSTERVVTVSSSPQDVTLATTLDDASVRPLAGLVVPPGYVTQIRLVTSSAAIDLRGATYPVKIPSGAQSGIKIVPSNGPLVVPQSGPTGIVLELPIFDGLIRNRGQGFMLPPGGFDQSWTCICTIDQHTGECASIKDPGSCTPPPPKQLRCGSPERQTVGLTELKRDPAPATGRSVQFAGAASRADIQRVA